jgi:hypothetical protein
MKKSSQNTAVKATTFPEQVSVTGQRLHRIFFLGHLLQSIPA